VLNISDEVRKETGDNKEVCKCVSSPLPSYQWEFVEIKREDPQLAELYRIWFILLSGVHACDTL